MSSEATRKEGRNGCLDGFCGIVVDEPRDLGIEPAKQLDTVAARLLLELVTLMSALDGLAYD